MLCKRLVFWVSSWFRHRNAGLTFIFQEKCFRLLGMAPDTFIFSGLRKILSMRFMTSFRPPIYDRISIDHRAVRHRRYQYRHQYCELARWSCLKIDEFVRGDNIFQIDPERIEAAPQKIRSDDSNILILLIWRSVPRRDSSLGFAMEVSLVLSRKFQGFHGILLSYITDLGHGSNTSCL